MNLNAVWCDLQVGRRDGSGLRGVGFCLKFRHKNRVQPHRGERFRKLIVPVFYPFIWF